MKSIDVLDRLTKDRVAGPTTMKALVYHGAGRRAWEDEPRPMDTTPGPIRTAVDYAVGFGEILLLTMLVPVGILAVGLPIVLLVRVLLEIVRAL